MNRRSTTVVLGGAVLGIIILLSVYLGLIVTGVIDTRPGALVIVAQDAQKTYDGEPLSSAEYSIKSGKLKDGHKIIATSTAEQMDVGARENNLDIKIVDKLGADVTSHYNLEVKQGTLTVNPCKLVLRSGSTQKVYDGTPLEYDFWEVVAGSLPDAVELDAIFTASRVEPGQTKNTFVAVLTDQFGRDASRNFSISYLYGTLSVTKRPLTVTSYGASKIYDGEELRYEEYTVDGELLDGHYLDVVFPASITNAGSVTNNILVTIMSEYADVTACYELTVRVGTLKVEPRPIEISATPAIKHFEGDDLPSGTWYLTKGTLVDGHEIIAEVEPVKNDENTVEYILRNVGVYESMGKSARAGEGSRVRVTENYDITLVHGIDRDRLYELTLASGSKSMPYTGQPLTCEQYMLASGKLADGHTIHPLFTGTQTEIGMSANTFTVAILDENGDDVTYRYNIQYQYGTLEVYANVPGSGGEIMDDGGISQGGTQNQTAVAARVWASKGGRVYLRWKSYGEYVLDAESGKYKWIDAMAYPLAGSNMLFTVGRALAADGRDSILYSIELQGGQYLIPNYVAEGPTGAVNDVCLSPTNTAYSLSSYVWSYSYADALRYAAAGISDEEMKAYTAFVYNQYLAIPESTKAVLLEIAEQQGLRADRLSIIEDVANYVRGSATYDVDFTACPDGEDEVVYFLTESKSGVCRHFASAATLMYRALGIPARYVVGYNTYATGETWTEVSGKDAHAWVEVFITGLGWVRMDPTPATGSADQDALVIGLSKVMGYYNGLPYKATEDNVVLINDVLKDGHELASVEVLGSQIEAGVGVSTIGEVVIVDADGNDVTAEYTIVRQDGIIEVRKPVVTLRATSAKKVFDGTELTAPTYTYSFHNAAFSALYTVSATVSGSQTDIGQSANEIGEVIITDPLGRDITSNFEIKRVAGTLKVYLYDLTVTTASSSRVYNAQPLQASGVSYDSASLTARGHTLEYSLPSLTNVGSIYNTPTWRIVDGDGNDVSAEYNVQINAGVLRVTPVELVLQTDSAEKVYDGKPLQVSGFTTVSGEPVEGHRMASFRITGSQTNVGVSEANVVGILIVDSEGRDVTANYRIKVLPGTLLVTAP